MHANAADASPSPGASDAAQKRSLILGVTVWVEGAALSWTMIPAFGR